MAFDARGLVYEFEYGLIADWFAADNDAPVRPVPKEPDTDGYDGGGCGSDGCGTDGCGGD